ncbi:MAG TPA: FUSC family protein [Crenalkalicoccus sp.]|jgi:uncharacterized membrane protein YccC|nr:FUSC family protein [Crenalkalicoccus sp.]
MANSFRLGTPRNPGADLSRLPLGLDLRAIRVAEGLRAALACAIVLLANEWLGWPPLVYLALAAFFTCLCDIGGPIRLRLPALLAFTLLGAATWAVFGLLRNAGLPLVVPLVCAAIFCTSFIRVWGAAATAVGNLLSIVLILSLDRPLDGAEAALIAGLFVAGGLWATLLTLVVWRLHPYRPARTAVAEVWRRLAALSADLLDLARRGDVGAMEWEAHARAHRHAVREEIEHARTIVMDLVSMRGRLSLRGSQALLRLEAADQIFGALIALSDLLEMAEPATLRRAGPLLRLLRPMLLVLARSMLTDAPLRLPRLERAIRTALAGTAGDPTLHAIAGRIADRLRIAAKLATPAGYLRDRPVGGEPAQPWRDRVLGPLRANLTWRSAMLRHALRTAVVAAPALAFTLSWDEPFAHWLTITVVVTMQPFYATTWQRALERIGGTVLGGVIGAILAYFTHSPIVFAGLLVPLCVIAFAARQVSFGAWIVFLTPVIVVLMELVEPGHSSWAVAGLRALFTALGGLIAVIGWLALWPSWEPDRLRQEIGNALRAHADYAGAVFSELLGALPAAGTEAARRTAGVATNNLEASLARLLQEPGHENRLQVEAPLVVAATLRRIVGRLAAVHHGAAELVATDPEPWRAWRDWITGALAALARDEGLRGEAPQGAPLESLARIGRQIELLEGALRRLRQSGGTAGERC